MMAELVIGDKNAPIEVSLDDKQTEMLLLKMGMTESHIESLAEYSVGLQALKREMESIGISMTYSINIKSRIWRGSDEQHWYSYAGSGGRTHSGSTRARPLWF